MCVVAALLTCTACFISQWVVYRWLGSQEARYVALISEENTLIRLQQSYLLQGETLFMGSSLTERLLSNGKNACLAVPGSSFTAALSLLKDPKQFLPGTVYVLELNNMGCENNENILKKTREWKFNYFRDSSHFSFAAKPSNLIVSTIFHWLNKKEEHNVGPFSDIEATPLDTSACDNLTPNELKNWKNVIQGIELIRSRGGKICFVYMPLKKVDFHYEEAYRQGCKLAKHMNIPVLDYQHTDVFKYLQFTDDTHVKPRHINSLRLMKTIARDAKLHAVE